MLIVLITVYLLQTILNTVLCRREPLQRFIVEEGVKPPIFGSYSYDPLRQVFEPPPADKNDTLPNQFYNNTHVLSTVLGPEHTVPTSNSNNTSVYFRKHVTYFTQNTTPWWARAKHRMNSTMKHRYTK